MFKKGDKVRVIQSTDPERISYSNKLLIGRLCTVKDVQYGYCTLEEEPQARRDAGFSFDYGGVWFAGLELANDYVEPKLGTFSEELTKIRNRLVK